MKKLRKVFPENIPAELKERSQWVCWKAVSKAQGKTDKIPICPRNGKPAATNNPETWGSFDEAMERYDKYQTVTGVGFVFTEMDPYCGIDLDDCRDPETNEFTHGATRILTDLNSYSEISPSERGVKVICKAKLPGRGRTGDGIEIYDRGRFFTITGRWLGEYSGYIEDRQEKALGLYQKLGKGKSKYDGGNPKGWQDETLKGVVAGSRHRTALKLAGRWVEMGLSDAEIIQFLIYWNETNKPPKQELSDPNGKELKDIVSYVREKHKEDEKQRTAPTMADLRAYLDLEVGPGQPITSDEICRALGAQKRSDRQNIYKGLSRLVESGELKRDQFKHGCYRRVSVIPSYDLTSEMEENNTFGVKLPMDLNNLIDIKPSQLVGISGRYDSGKSSFLFDIERRNYEKVKIIHILSEEWSIPAIKERLELLGIPIPHPNISFYPMLPGWEDLILHEPAIILVDYVRADQNPFEVDAQIQRMLRNLNGGVVFFATQKHPGYDRPVGGQFAVHAVHHMLMLDRWRDAFVCKIFRTKSERNLEGYYRTFIFHDQKCLVPKMRSWKPGELKWERKSDTD